jgi:hypothetical protein
LILPTTKQVSPKRILPNKQQRHQRVTKLKDLYPEDPSKILHRYPKRSNRTVKSGQTVTYSDDTLPTAKDNLPAAPDDNS